ncbi:hypothetical protein [Deinococcus arenicola]|uniref:hypothetical protein n=1 Tax=Deinococcus arenicola TaxID=2994950 RepID=UPI002953F81A|nr:hypothetical protein [Deinococcus sp. ZS9-10]
MTRDAAFAISSLTAEGTAGRLAWSIPTVFGVMGGIQLGLGVWWGVLTLGLGVLLALRDARPLLAVLALLGAAVGFGSERLVTGRADPLAPWIGGQVTLTGEWDGQFLTLKDPRARLAVAPKPTSRAGKLVVSGRLVAPEGQRTPGGFNQAAWLRAQGGLLMPMPTAVLVAAKVRDSQPEKGLRGWFRRGLTVGLPARQAALMTAIELGDRNDIGREEFTEGYGIWTKIIINFKNLPETQHLET